MKKTVIIVSLLTVGVFAATNFSNMSNAQLQSMRGKVTLQDRSAFRAEMQKRVQSGTMAKGQGMGMSQGNRQGMGQGQGKNKLY